MIPALLLLALFAPQSDNDFYLQGTVTCRRAIVYDSEHGTTRHILGTLSQGTGVEVYGEADSDYIIHQDSTDYDGNKIQKEVFVAQSCINVPNKDEH